MNSYGLNAIGNLKVQSVATLPSSYTSATDKRRLIWVEDEGKLYVGGNSSWEVYAAGTAGTAGTGGTSGSSGSSGTNGSRGESFQVDDSGELTEAVVTTIEGLGASSNDFYVYLVTEDNRVTKTLPAGISGDQALHVVMYDGTAWHDYGQFTGLQGVAGTSGSGGTSGTDGTAGSGGTSGTNGTAGTGGTDGTAGSGGTSGTDGTAGSGGTSGTDGTAGTGGTSGTDGTAGSGGTSGTNGSRGESFQVDDSGELTEAVVTTIEGLGASSNDFYVYLVTTDNRTTPSLPAGIAGDQSLHVVMYDGTAWHDYGQFTGLKGVDGTSGSSGTSGTNATAGTGGTSGTDGTAGTGGTSGTDGTAGTGGTSGTSGTDGTAGTGGTSGTDGTAGTGGSSGTSGSRGESFQVDASGALDEARVTTIEGLGATPNDFYVFLVTTDDRVTPTAPAGISGAMDKHVVMYDGTDWHDYGQFTGLDGIDGTSGSSGTSGTNATAGTGGTSGTDGTAGTGGTSGTDGTAGSGGTSGTNGTAGTGGTDGTAGSGGTSGTDGTAGSGGTSGTDGTAGTGGTSGTSAVTGGFLFTKAVAASTWNIQHDLNFKYVSVTCVVDDVQVQPDSVTYVDNNNVTVDFGAYAVAGFASVVVGGGTSGSSGTGVSGTAGTSGTSGNTLLTVPPASDHTVSGPNAVMTAGETLTQSQLCYMKSDGKWWKANASAVGTMPGMAIAMAGITANDTGSFALPGSFVRDDSWTWATVGALIYADVSAGAMSLTAPSATTQQVQVVGYVVSATVIYFAGSPTLIEIK